MDSWISWYNTNTQFLKLISIAENWISCSKINESEDDFMKILYVMKFCFAIVGFKEQIENIWMWSWHGGVENCGAKVIIGIGHKNFKIWLFHTSKSHIS
jgi:hypothetical protein